MAGGSAEQGDLNSTERTRQNEREEGRPSLISLAFVRRATAPANAASIDLKDWRRGVYEGLLFEDNKKKFWVDEKLHKNCLLVLPKAIYLEGGERNITWQWIQTKEKCFGGDVDIPVPLLLQLSWLHIKGSFNTNALSPKTTYEAAFVVKLRTSSNSWPLPVNLELHLPDGSKVITTESLAKKPKEKWVKLRIGKFVMDPKNVGALNPKKKMEAGAATNGGSTSADEEINRQSRGKEGGPSLNSLVIMRKVTSPSGNSSVDIKDWRRVVYEGVLLANNTQAKSHFPFNSIYLSVLTARCAVRSVYRSHGVLKDLLRDNLNQSRN